MVVVCENCLCKVIKISPNFHSIKRVSGVFFYLNDVVGCIIFCSVHKYNDIFKLDYVSSL